MLDKGIIVGCDQNVEWLLPWFWNHYTQHNHLPVAFFDFGMSDSAIAFCKTRGLYFKLDPQSTKRFDFNTLDKVKETELSLLCHLEYVKTCHHAWMKKPLACNLSPFQTTIWLDLDCKVKIDLTPLFEFVDETIEISLAKNREFIGSSLRLNGYLYADEDHLNSGVIIFKKGSLAIQSWLELTLSDQFFKGDEEALSRAIYLNQIPYHVLDSAYNCLDFDQSESDCFIQHYCCCQGKIAILKEILETEKTCDSTS